MNWDKLKRVFCGVLEKMREPYYQGVAAELAFFFLMSMLPMVIILAEIMGVFSLSIDLVEKFLSNYISEEIIDNVLGYLDYKSSNTFSVLFIVFALWSASKAQFSMMKIANYTYTGGNKGKGFLKERIRAMATLLTTLLILVFSLAFLIYGEPIKDAILYYVIKILALPFNFNELWMFLRWPLAVAFYILSITFVNYILPSQRLPVKKIIPGSILTSCGMLLASWVYSMYISGFSNYDLFYGSLASVVGLLMWFYILGYVIVVGIVLNSILMEEA